MENRTPWQKEREFNSDAKEEPSSEAPERGLPGGQWHEPVCGIHAVGSLFHCKPFIVDRLFFDAEFAPMLGEICKFLAKEKKVYRQVEHEELAKIAGTRQHGGVVAIARRRPLELATAKTAAFWAKEGMPLLILDGIGETRDLGGLARVSAYFGIEKFLVAQSMRQVMPSELAYRVARGGLDMVDLRLVENVPAFLKQIGKSYFKIGLDMEGVPLPEYMGICPEGKLDLPVAFVIGNEETGLTKPTADSCDALIGIPGSGAIDRLELATEASLLIQKYLVEA